MLIAFYLFLYFLKGYISPATCELPLLAIKSKFDIQSKNFSAFKEAYGNILYYNLDAYFYDSTLTTCDGCTQPLDQTGSSLVQAPKEAKA